MLRGLQNLEFGVYLCSCVLGHVSMSVSMGAAMSPTSPWMSLLNSELFNSLREPASSALIFSNHGFK